MDYLNNNNNINNNYKTVCIIGSGPSGLTACKSSLESGLIPFVLERRLTFGGVWSLDQCKPWDSMYTNVSHYSMTFSDFEHPRNQDMFLHHKKVYEYLSNYSHQYGLNKYLNFNCNVVKVVQIENDRWLVDWEDGSNKSMVSREFDYLIVCGGMNHTPKPFNMNQLKSFTGGYKYAKDYRSPNEYVGKRVLVVGKSCSGLQIASELCNSGASNVYLYGKGKLNEWCLSADNSRIKTILKNNGLDNDTKDSGVPLDFIAYVRKSVYELEQLPENERNIALNKFFKQLSGNNGNEPSYYNDESQFDKPFQILFTGIDSYIDNIKQGKIKCLSNHSIKSSSGKTFEFKNELDQSKLNIEFDEIIFATGYSVNFSFFEKKILDKLEFDSNDNFIPCLLYQYTISPHINGLGFVGIYGTPFYTLIELQSRWISYLFAGIIKPPSYDKMLKGIEEVKKIRNLKYKPTFPFKNYVVFCDQLAKEIDCLPNFEEMKSEDPELYNMCWNSLLTPAAYRLCGPFSNKKKAIQTIKHYYNSSIKLYK